MSITKNTEYALRALYEISSVGRGRPVSRKVISERQQISEPFLEKLFIPMQKAGIIQSVRGPGGGFLLGRSAGEITVWDVFSTVDSKAHFYEKCANVTREECDHMERCKIKYVWSTLNRILRESMAGISLADISRKNWPG